MLLCTVQALGELAVLFPVNGAFYTYVVRFVDPSWGFAMGWDYAIGWLTVLPFELTAAGITIQFWREDINIGVWITVSIFFMPATSCFRRNRSSQDLSTEFWLQRYPQRIHSNLLRRSSWSSYLLSRSSEYEAMVKVCTYQYSHSNIPVLNLAVEFILSIIKVAGVIGFIILGVSTPRLL